MNRGEGYLMASFKQYLTPLRGATPTLRWGTAGVALALLLSINLFNYIDRYLLAAVMPHIEKTFFSSPERSGSLVLYLVAKFHHAFGFTPRLALGGLLSSAFMVTYMIASP